MYTAPDLCLVRLHLLILPVKSLPLHPRLIPFPFLSRTHTVLLAPRRPSPPTSAELPAVSCSLTHFGPWLALHSAGTPRRCCANRTQTHPGS